VGTDPLGEAMVDSADLQLHGLVAANARAAPARFLAAPGFLGLELHSRHAGTDHTATPAPTPDTRQACSPAQFARRSGRAISGGSPPHASYITRPAIANERLALNRAGQVVLH